MIEYNYYPNPADFMEEEVAYFGKHFSGLSSAYAALSCSRRKAKELLCKELINQQEQSICLPSYVLEDNDFENDLHGYEHHMRKLSLMKSIPLGVQSSSGSASKKTYNNSSSQREEGQFVDAEEENLNLLKLSIRSNNEKQIPKVSLNQFVLSKYFSQDLSPSKSINTTFAQKIRTQEPTGSDIDTSELSSSNNTPLEHWETNLSSSSSVDSDAAWRAAGHRLAVHLQHLTQLSSPEINIFSLFKK